MFLNAAKCQVTAFTVSELLRENQQGVKLSPTPRLGLAKAHYFLSRVYTRLYINGYILIYVLIYAFNK